MYIWNHKFHVTTLNALALRKNAIVIDISAAGALPRDPYWPSLKITGAIHCGLQVSQLSILDKQAVS